MNSSSDQKENPKDGWHPELNQDEAIIAQEKRIECEITVQTPLVSDKMDLSCLIGEYSDEDQIFQSKIKQDLMDRYEFLRRTRPDGNCFFRGFTYAYFEYLLSDNTAIDRFINLANKTKQDLIGLGYKKFTIEDIHESFINVLTMIKNGQMSTVKQLEDLFNQQSISDYLVVFMRLLTSCYLQLNSDFFSSFIEGDITIKEFCNLEVEPMFKESDHIHIIALTSATGIGICINYLDRGNGDKVTLHLFPDGCDPKIHLLYRPGHYDVLYPRVKV